MLLPRELPFDPGDTPAPCYVVDAEGLRQNGRILQEVTHRTGARILLAMKAFAMHPAFPVLRPYLAGTTASSKHEARMGSEEFGKELHSYAVAYSPEDFDFMRERSMHLTLNSLTQWEQLKGRIPAGDTTKFGLRINPNYSEIEFEIYNPCRSGSRLGMTWEDLAHADLDGITGLHFHTLCEQGSGTLERTVEVVEEHFSTLLHRMEWLNLGGGHHITKPDYDVERLVRLLIRLKDTYDLDLILEPGEAVVQESGWLISEVLDVFESQGIHHAILGTSSTAHMPDVLEMPYRPHILGSGEEAEKAYTYQLGGVTCLAGDRIGVFSFDTPLTPGSRLVFTDMAMYSMVKSTHFNGIPHPSIALWDPEGAGLTVSRSFGYDDFKSRLG